MKDKISKVFNAWNHEDTYSGVFSVSNADSIIYEQSRGYRNRAERLLNEASTAFGIASGTKMFTGLAVCKLIDEGRVSLEDKIWDILPYDLKSIDKKITVYHLLTHTSGIGDYIDEESPNSYDDMIVLYSRYPVYLWNDLSYYLPMFNELPAKFSPGERYGYSNAGFILLGLIIEIVSRTDYHNYIMENIIRPCGLTHTGYYRMDCLPQNTALGYIYKDNMNTKEWHTNIFKLPIVGGSDGGLFTCASDLDKLWRSIFSDKILSAPMLDKFLMPHVAIGSDQNNIYYGLGLYRYQNKENTAYFALGGDYGVDFFTIFFPKHGIVASALGNTQMNTWPLLEKLFRVLA